MLGSFHNEGPANLAGPRYQSVKRPLSHLELEVGATRDRESEKRTNADGDALNQTHVLLLPTI